MRMLVGVDEIEKSTTTKRVLPDNCVLTPYGVVNAPVTVTVYEPI